MSDSSNDELLARVERASRLAEAPPAEVVRQAVDAYAWRGVSTSWAAIDYDSALDDDDSARVRAGSRDRRLRFRGSLGAIEVSVVDGGERLIGRVQPVSAGAVEMRGPTWTRTTVTDHFGQFAFGSIERGPVSFYWQPQDNATGFDTEWVTI